MKLQKSKYSNTCFFTSFAMALGLDQEVIFDLLGHRGNIKVFDAPEPFCYRSGHPQEIIDVALKLNRYIVQVDRLAFAEYNEQLFSIPFDKERFTNHIMAYRGVLCTKTHAMAWDNHLVYDPIGTIYQIEKVINDVEIFFIVI